MNQRSKFRPNYLFTGILPLVMLCTVTWKTAIYHTVPLNFYSSLTTLADTTKPIEKKDSTDSSKNLLTDTIPNNDSSGSRQKIDTFPLKLSKDSLDAPVKYEAKDSAVLLVQDKKIIMYGKTKTDYKDITLTAPKVELDQETEIVTAINNRQGDSVVETAHFKQKENEFTSDTIRFNFKTQKGLTENTITKQNDFFVHGSKIKKVNDNTTFIKNAMFTTCDLDDPHFYIMSNKMKFINDKLAVSGPAHIEFEGVPIPIYVPFGFYPITNGRHSGLLPPQFTTNQTFGLGLEGGGYYKVINDNWDVKTYGNIYSYGSWSLNINPTYRKRYHYNGMFVLAFQNSRLNFPGDPDFSKTKTFNITWNHQMDSKARPGVTFSANVNAGSTKYNQLIPNGGQLTYQNSNTPINFQNQMFSSISFSKMWTGTPFSLTMNANHNQNNLTHLINVSLPDAGFTMNTIYPFQKKEFVGTPKWYEKLGLAYTGTFRNQVSFYDTAFKLNKLLDTLQWGAQHNFPITLSLPPILGGAVIVSPGVSYSQTWIAQKMRMHWDSTNQKLDTTTTKGLFMDHTASFSLGLSTAIFGMYQFKDSRHTKIRHVIRPTLSFSYKPDLSKQHYYTTQVDSFGQKLIFSEYQRSLYGYYSQGKFGGMSIQVDNNLEMKKKSNKEGDTTDKKIHLIDNYGFQTSYNFYAPTMKLAPLQFYLNTILFEKLNFSGRTTLDPYKVNQYGQDTGIYAWQGGKFNLGRFTTGSVSFSYTFKSKPKDPKKDEERKKQMQQQLNDPALMGDQQRLLDYMQQNPSQFVDFNIPWQLTFSYSFLFTQQIKPDYSGFKNVTSSNVSFNESVTLTPKWNFGTNGYYDLSTNRLQTFSMNISRDMHCWQMTITVTPVGFYRSFNITISPKASVLQDLKINRTRNFNN